MKRGRMLYDPDVERFFVAYDYGGWSERLCCGRTICLEDENDGQRRAARLDLDADDHWYYAGLPGNPRCRLGDIVWL